jgi:hypothetical protein
MLDVDDAPAAFRYRLDPTTGVYVATETTGTSKISVTARSRSPWSLPT